MEQFSGLRANVVRKIRAVEEEFDEPFWDVVKGFASDGHSLQGTESILELGRDFIKRIMIKYGVDIEFARGSNSVLFRQAREDSKGVCTAAHKASLAKANANNDHNAHQLAYKGVTDSLVGHSRREGISYRTVVHRYGKNKNLDYVFFKGSHLKKPVKAHECG